MDDVPLPVGKPNPARRLKLIAAETAARKHKAHPEAGTGIFRFVHAQRLWYRQFPRQRSVTLVVNNVPGPPVPLYLAGARILELFPTLPAIGNLTSPSPCCPTPGSSTSPPAGDGCPDAEAFADGVRSAPDDLALHQNRDGYIELVPRW